MSRVTRPPRAISRVAGPRNSVNDRLGRLALLRRRARRLLRPIAWALIVSMAALIVVGLVRGAGTGGFFAGINAGVARLTADAGMRVRHVEIEGRANTPAPLLRAAIGVAPGDPMLGFSLTAARSRIESLSWVESATVERRLPDTIVVSLVERRPFAIWQNKGKFVLIDRTGQVVAGQDVSAFSQLPLVVGVGAPEAAATLLDALTERPALQSRVVAAVRVGQRRWDLRMTGGIDVMLPEGAVPQALDRLAQLQSTDALLDRPLAAVDLRLPDRLVVRPVSTPATPADDQHATPTKRPT